MADIEKIGLDLPLFQAPVIKEAPKKVQADNSENENNGDKASEKKTRRVVRKSNSSREEDQSSKHSKDASKRKNDEQVKKDEENTNSSSEPRKRVRTRSNKKDTSKSGGSVTNKPLTSTRVDAKSRRKDMRNMPRRRNLISEANFLAERDDVERKMVIRDVDGSQQISILEDNILVEHYVSEQSEASVVGNVYLGRIQNVLPGMEAAFVDIGVGRNGVLYAGEVNWDETGLVDGEPKRIEQAIKKGDVVMVQATKDPIGQKGARLTAQVTLAGRFLVLVPSSGIAGISKKLSDKERKRLKDIVKANAPEDAGIIIRTAAGGVSEEEIIADIKRLTTRWEDIQEKSQNLKAPATLYADSNMSKRVIRETFNDDFKELIISGDKTYDEVKAYLDDAAPELTQRVTKWTDPKKDIFDALRINEQLAKSFDRKVWLSSGGTLVIDRTEAMTVIDINTGKFTGSKTSSLEETVTQNNLEAAEEIVRQLRLRDIGGIVVIDFIDMVLDDNREKVLRRLIECLMRDRTKHQVAEVTSLGLVQLTRKRVGQGLIEAFSTTCDHCAGKGYIVQSEPVKKDINALVTPEIEDWDHNFVGASHELADGTKIARIDKIDDEQREKNKNLMSKMAKAIESEV